MIIFGYIFLILASVLLVYSFINYWDLPNGIGNSLFESLTTEELGDMEGRIKNLKEVIVIADNIEEPTSKLYDAVKNNLERNVKYTFLISKKNFNKQLESYFSIFEAIAKAKNLEHFLHRRRLGGDRWGYPFLGGGIWFEIVSVVRRSLPDTDPPNIAVWVGYLTAILPGRIGGYWRWFFR